MKPKDHDPVNHPQHYTGHPSGVECITITRHMGFNLGNAFKYIWRADLKGNAVEDLRKAEFYIRDEIAKRLAPAAGPEVGKEVAHPTGATETTNTSELPCGLKRWTGLC